MEASECFGLDLKTVLCLFLSELHVVMAVLRAPGASTGSSEAGVYGPAVLILKCIQHKMSLRVHIM